MAALKALLLPAEIDVDNEAEAEAAIELASDYLNREDFDEVPASVEMGVRKLCAAMVNDEFGEREVKAESGRGISVTYADRAAHSELPSLVRSYLASYRYTPGL